MLWPMEIRQSKTQQILPSPSLSLGSWHLSCSCCILNLVYKPIRPLPLKKSKFSPDTNLPTHYLLRCEYIYSYVEHMCLPIYLPIHSLLETVLVLVLVLLICRFVSWRRWFLFVLFLFELNRIQYPTFPHAYISQLLIAKSSHTILWPGCNNLPSKRTTEAN